MALRLFRQDSIELVIHDDGATDQVGIRKRMGAGRTDGAASWNGLVVQQAAPSASGRVRWLVAAPWARG